MVVGDISSLSSGRQSPGLAGSGPAVREDGYQDSNHPETSKGTRDVLSQALERTPNPPLFSCKTEDCPFRGGVMGYTSTPSGISKGRQWWLPYLAPTCLMSAGFLGPLGGRFAAAEGICVTNTLTLELGW